MSGAHEVLDPFELLGLIRQFRLSLHDLDRAYFEAQKRWHPDRFVQASPHLQEEALERTAQLNEAYRVLKDPVKRSERLLRLHDPKDPYQPVVPHVAQEAFLWRERLQECLEGPEASQSVDTLMSEAQEMYQKQCDQFEVLWDQAYDYNQARDIFQSMAFYAKLIREADQ